MRLYIGIAIGALAVSSSISAFGKPAPWTDYYNVQRSPDIPKKVRKFVIDAQACAHFSGELSGDESGRERQVQRALAKTCKDIDIRHDTLSKTYKGNAEVEAILAEVYEPFL